MPKLERTYQPIFGSQGNNDEFAVFGSMKTGTPVYSKTLKTLFESPAFLQGWQNAVAADKAPFLEEMNALFLSLFQQVAYGLQTGIPEYDPNTTYYANSFCQVNGVIYKSLTDENIGNNPATDTTNWEEFKSGGGSSLPIGTMFFSQGFVDISKGLADVANGQIRTVESLPKGFVDWVVESAALNSDFATTEQNWQAEAALNPDGICGKYVINKDDSGNVVSLRFPKYPDWAVNDQIYSFPSTVPVRGNGQALGFYNNNDDRQFVLRQYADLSANSYGAYFSPSSLPIATGASISSQVITSDRNKAMGVATDPTKSGLIAELGSISSSSAKVKGKWYIQIATGQETEVIVNNKQELLSGLTLFEPKYSATPLYDVKYILAGSNHTKAVYPDTYAALLVELNPDIAVGTTVDITDTFSYTKQGLDVKEIGDSAITDYSWVINKTDETFAAPKKYPFGPMNTSSTIPVIGNGIALGLTDGNTNYGLGLSNANNSHLLIYTGNYGASQGVANSGASANGQVAYSVVTDPAKSGLVAKLASAAPNAYLYFCVATVGQNAALANLGRIGEEISRVAQKMSPNYNSGTALDKTKGKVTPITEDCYLYAKLNNLSGEISFIHITLCDINGTNITELVDLNTQNDKIITEVWSPLIKKGSYIKVNNINTNLNNYQLFTYPATGGIS